MTTVMMLMLVLVLVLMEPSRTLRVNEVCNEIEQKYQYWKESKKGDELKNVVGHC